MKRLNRRKLIEEFEMARSGFAQACMKAAENNDELFMVTMAAHHTGVNRVIVGLGGEDVGLPDYSKFFTSNRILKTKYGE